MILIIALEFSTQHAHTVDPIELQKGIKIHDEFCVLGAHVTECTSLTYPNEKSVKHTKRTHAITTCGVRCSTRSRFRHWPARTVKLISCHVKLIVRQASERPTVLCCVPLPPDTTKVGWLKLRDVMPMCFLFISFFLFFSLFPCFCLVFTLRNSKKWRTQTICLAVCVRIHSFIDK